MRAALTAREILARLVRERGFDPEIRLPLREVARRWEGLSSVEVAREFALAAERVRPDLVGSFLAGVVALAEAIAAEERAAALKGPAEVT